MDRYFASPFGKIMSLLKITHFWEIFPFNNAVCVGIVDFLDAIASLVVTPSVSQSVSESNYDTR